MLSEDIYKQNLNNFSSLITSNNSITTNIMKQSTKKCETQLNEISSNNTRPSSPRKFFERLYGHLETNKKDTTYNIEQKPTTSPSLSTNSSNSIDHFDEINKIPHKYGFLQEQEYQFSSHNSQQFSSHFESLRMALGMPAETMFPPGLAAFCKLKKLTQKKIEVHSFWACFLLI